MFRARMCLLVLLDRPRRGGVIVTRRDSVPQGFGVLLAGLWCDTSHVRGWFGHRGDDGLARLDDELAGLGRPLAVADRSCCCPARPAVTVVMPPAPGRPHLVDLLLCGHHYQAGRAALHAAGATVYDEAGVLLMVGGSERPPARREPAAAAGG